MAHPPRTLLIDIHILSVGIELIHNTTRAGRTRQAAAAYVSLISA